MLNYFGQGALVLADASAIENPFYRMMPESLLMPMIVLATVATVIASQAVITGAYSLVAQAIQLGLLPRLAIRHTSAAHHGQIYIPRVTVALLAGVLLLVGLFRTSSALASAYGIAVTTTMVVDGILGLLVVWKLWNWKLWQAAALVAPLVFVDAVFFSANLLKIFDGAWAPIAFGSSMVLIILTWRRGTGILAQKTRRTEVPLETLVRSLQRKPPHVVPGTAVFLTSDPDFAPTSLLHNLKHNKVLHEHNVILTIVTADTPRVSDEERVRMTRGFTALQQGRAQVRLYGIAQRAESAGDRPQARLAFRHHVDVVFPVAPLAETRRPFRDAALAGSSFHHVGKIGERCDGLLPNSDRPGRRSRHASDRMTII